MTVTFEQIDIIDYYDGLVRGIGRTQAGAYLLVLSKWKFAQRYKEFVALELDPKTVYEFESQFELSEPTTSANWSRFENAFNLLVGSFRGRILKFCAEPMVGEPIAFQLVDDVKFATKLLDYELESVIDDG
jgi:hypothetical protein